MSLKRKVKTIGGIIFVFLIVCISGFMAYFSVSDNTLSKPPETSIANNLFIEKNLIDIENLDKMNDMVLCRNLYYNTWSSIYEDYTNFFLDKNGFFSKNTQENENQYQSFWKKLNFAYSERFMSLADNYFGQTVWNNNTLIHEIINEIKKTGFVERNTSTWDNLQSYENNISCYSQMQKYINWANQLNFNSYFPAYEMGEIKKGKAALENRNCKKNANIANELNSSYNDMRERAKGYLEAKIKRYDRDFDEQKSNSISYEKEAYKKYNEIKSEVEQWNSLFYYNEKLNSQLQTHKQRLDIQYY